MPGKQTDKPSFGTAAPWFKAQLLDSTQRFSFDTVAGRVVILFFMGSTSIEPVHQALNRLLAAGDAFDDSRISLLGVTVDPQDAARGAIATRIPGIRYITDYDRAVSTAYGACQSDSERYLPYILVLDRQLRAAGRFSLAQTGEALALARQLADEPAPDDWAPVLLVPRVFEPELCAKLIGLYEEHGGEESGFMREVDGKTITVVDPRHKRRSDYIIEDRALCEAITARIHFRLRPMVQRAFSFDATRIERHIVACYDSTAGGHFRPHRDNTTKGTAHRRFAVSINLNDDFEGGDLRFPEFGTRTYRPPPGGAVVFGCSILHEATPIVHGRRFAFLPFLYDDAAAAIREANNAYLGDGVDPYQDQPPS